MRIGIVARPDIPGAVETVNRVIRLLAGEEITLEPGLARKLGKPAAKTRALSKADAIITVGGDGTILFAQLLAPDVPILGINLGGRGFLADISPREMPRALRMLRAGKLDIMERDKLAAVARGKRLPDALNDVVIFSDKPGKTVSLRVSVDGMAAIEMRGDGVIVATPTGSTAYSHAAGGPVLDPRLNAIVVVPICPSHPRPCPMTLPIESSIEIEPTRPGRDAVVIVDGNPAAKLPQGGKIKISRSENKAKFFKWGDFYRKVVEKLL